MKRRIGLIDGDIPMYQACAASECEIQWDDQIYTLSCDVQKAANIFNDFIEKWKEQLNLQKIIVAIGCAGKNSFRKGFYPEYKANRRSRRPMGMLGLKEYVRHKYATILSTHLESDDLLGLWATNPNIEKGWQKTIISIDKDMLTLPKIYLYRPGIEENIIYNSPFDADYNFMLQTLTGDNTDNYPGCSGIGPVTGAKILEGKDTLEEMWEAIVKTYEKKGKTEEDAIIQARLARILRHGDYNWDTEKIKLWTPS